MVQLIEDIVGALRAVDNSGIPFKNFRPGVGPYGEPQLVKLIAAHLAQSYPERYEGIKTCRVPDVLIPERWALEFKIVRPFGDNDVEAEHWSQNLLHPYEGNVSAIGDSIKLLKREGKEERGLIVIVYEHAEPRIDVEILVSAFELVSRQLLGLHLGERRSHVLNNCVHPVHQRTTIYGWHLGS